MDQFHDRFAVYDDVSSAGNHFPAFAKIPGEDAPVAINGSSTNNPHSGATAIKCELLAGGGPFGGFYFQNGVLPAGATAPLPNFGTVPDAGFDLTGATALTFWARGELGGEKVDFFMGGVGRDSSSGMATAPFPDSTPRRPAIGTTFTLTTEWQKFTISLAGADLSYVLGGFGWVASLANNPAGAVFHLDDIQYELNDARRAQRLNEPRFLRSFTTAPFQSRPAPVNDFDLVLRNSAFTYDNALALLAFLADGTPDSLRRARLIGDAFVYASNHDRSFDDGRLRSDYAAGDISLAPGWTPNNRRGTAPVPGFQIEGQGFVEVEQQSVDTGNNAWAMIALLALYRRTSDDTYLLTARRVGNFIRTFRNDAGTFRGFQGGVENPEAPAPTRRVYASTEHNLDVYAAFTAMFQITGEAHWLDGARHARQFAEAMWDAQRGCFLTGTTDPSTRNMNPGQLPLDVQTWAVLALPDALAAHPQVLACAEQNHRTVSDGFAGFDFNEDRDGVWFEGTAQMATAYAYAGRHADAEAVRLELRRAQQTPPFGDGDGLAAASHDGLSTGFNFQYFRRLHTGATAWNVFAQSGFNPYYQTTAAVVQFDSESYGVGEGDASVRVNVRRLGDTSGAAAVRYAATNGTASDRADYTAARGTLRFNSGEASKSFEVLITDDANVEGSETVRLTLDNVSGASVLGSPNVAVLTITDNDSVTTDANPIDGAQFFVRQHYHDFLNREPDAGGLAFWTDGITSCGADAQCVEVKRINTSAAFFLSIEFQETGYLVYRLYKTAYGNLPGRPVPLRLQEFLPDTQEIGRDVVVGVGDWQARLEANKNAFALDFVRRQRFTDAYPQTLSPAQFVDALNANAGGALSPAERDQLVGELAADNTAQGRARALRRVAEDEDLRRAETNKAFVLMQYFGYLRRNPDDPQDTNFDGYAFWLDKLDRFNGNFVDAEMVRAFISSIEYRQRFNTPPSFFHTEGRDIVSDATGEKIVFRGVNLNGLEFGHFENHPYVGVEGTNYFKPRPQDFVDLKAAGFNVIRVPFEWARLVKGWDETKPLPASLEPGYLAMLDEVVRRASAQRLQVILEMHDFLKYWSGQSAQVCVDASPAHQQMLAQTWRLLAAHFRGDANVLGYDLMNEPVRQQQPGEPCGSCNWPAIAQAITDAIRTEDTRHLIFVEGINFSLASDWPVANGRRAFVVDRVAPPRVVYSPHLYFDYGNDSRYGPDNPGVDDAAAPFGEWEYYARDRLQPMLAWAAAPENDVPLLVGETNVPCTAEWARALEHAFENFFDPEQLSVVAWNYINPAHCTLQACQLNLAACPEGHQLAVLRRHPGGPYQQRRNFVPLPADSLLYKDRLVNPWDTQTASFGQLELDFESTEQKFEGCCSVSVRFTANDFAGFKLFHHHGLDTRQFRALRFRIFLKNAGQDFKIWTTSPRRGCDPGPDAVFPSPAQQPSLGEFTSRSPDRWLTVEVPLARIVAPSDGIINGIAFQNMGAAQDTFYVDDVRLIP